MRRLTISIIFALLGFRGSVGFAQSINFQNLMEGYKETYKRSIEWYGQAAASGLAEAQYNLALHHYLGLGTPRNLNTARSLLKQAAEQGYPQAQELLGIMVFRGEGGAKDLEGARDLIKRAANSGSTNANLLLGMIHSTNTTDNRALTFFKKAAEAGSIQASYLLGTALLTFPEPIRNLEDGALWTLRAAEKNHPLAQLNAGLLSLAGLGVESSKTEALRWFLLAAKSQNPEAQFQVGYLYETGSNEDRSKAERWYRKAAIQGHREAQARLGFLYIAGGLVPPDAHDAFKWTRRAAEQGHPQAQYNIAHLLFRGIGHDRDLVRALAWMLLADQQQLEEASKALPYLKQQLSPSEQNQANKLFIKGALEIFGDGEALAGLPTTPAIKNEPEAKPEAKPEPVKVKSLEEKAAEGDPESQFELGQKKGGTNTPEGLQWLEKASAKGFKKAIDLLIVHKQSKAAELYKAARNKDVIQLLETILKLDENNFQTLLGLIKAHNSLSLDLDSEGKTEDYEKEILKTIELAEKLKSLFPDKGEPYLYLAIGNGNLAKLKGGQDKVKIGSKVEAFCKEAIKRDNSLGMAHAVLATYYINVAALPWILKTFAKTFLGKLPDVTEEDALKLYDDAIKADPELIYAYNKLGLVNKHLGKNEEAKGWFQKTIDLKPRNSQDRRTQAEAAKSLREL